MKDVVRVTFDNTHMDFPEGTPKEVMISEVRKARNKANSEKDMSWSDIAQGTLLKAAQGATFNYMDELAGLTSEDRQQKLRDFEDVFSRKYPIESTIAEIGGGIAGAFALPVGAAAKGAQLAGKELLGLIGKQGTKQIAKTGSRNAIAEGTKYIGKTAATGFTEGALAGAGASNADNLDDRISAGLNSGAEGAIFAPALGVTGKGIVRGGQKAFDYGRNLASPDRESLAFKKIMSALNGKDLNEVSQSLLKKGNSLFDVGGKSVADLGASSARKSLGAREIATNLADSRDNALQTMVNESANKISPDRDIVEVEEELKRHYKEAASPLYKDAFKVDIDVTDNLAKLFSRPSIQDGFNYAIRIAKEKGNPPETIRKIEKEIKLLSEESEEAKKNLLKDFDKREALKQLEQGGIKFKNPEDYNTFAKEFDLEPMRIVDPHFSGKDFRMRIEEANALNLRAKSEINKEIKKNIDKVNASSKKKINVSTETLDFIRRSLNAQIDDEAAKARFPGDMTTLGSTIIQTKSELDDVLKVNPKLTEARKVASDKAGRRAALKDGGDFFKNTDSYEVFSNNFNKLAADQKELYKFATMKQLRAEIANKMGESPARAKGFLRSLGEKPVTKADLKKEGLNPQEISKALSEGGTSVRNKLKLIIGDDKKFKEFISGIDNRNSKYSRQSKAFGGSQTAERLQTDGLLDEIATIPTSASGFANQFLGGLYKKMKSGMSEEDNRLIAQQIFETDNDAKIKILNKLRKSSENGNKGAQGIISKYLNIAKNNQDTVLSGVTRSYSAEKERDFNEQRSKSLGGY